MTRDPEILNEIRFLAQRLADHSFDSHVVRDGHFAAQGVTTKAQFRDFIIDVLSDPKTQFASLDPNNASVAFYNQSTNAFAKINVSGNDYGTFFQPDDRRAYFDKELKKAGRTSNISVEYGGYEALREKNPGLKKSPLRAQHAQAEFAAFKQNHGAVHGPAIAESEGWLKQLMRKIPIPTDMIADFQEANRLLNSSDNIGFFAGKDGTQSVILNADENKLIISDKKNGIKIVEFGNEDDLLTAYGKHLDTETKRLGSMPTEFAGKYDDIAAQFQKTTKLVARVGGKLSDLMRFAGKAAKVLGPLGFIGAVAEAEEMDKSADRLAEVKLISPEAAQAYKDTVTAPHVIQATVDPSLVCGEAGIQASFEEWCKLWNVPEAAKIELEPSSLIEMIFGEIGEQHSLENLPLEIQTDTPLALHNLIEKNARVTELSAQAVSEPDNEMVHELLENAQADLIQERIALLQSPEASAELSALIERSDYLARIPATFNNEDEVAPELIAIAENKAYIEQINTALSAGSKHTEELFQQREAATIAINTAYDHAKEAGVLESVDFSDTISDTPRNVETEPTRTIALTA